MSDTMRATPLAARMRPRTLDEFEGQEHILGPGRLLRRAIQADQLSSVLFYGPPGVGKTTLAQIIANTTKAQFLAINAVLAGIKDIREAIDRALDMRESGGRRTVLFIDEVHRFNKAQQDALLPHVENGTLILIGATTENPYFEVNKALVSRSRIFELRSLGDSHVRSTLLRAMADSERGLGRIALQIDHAALDHLVRMAGGDARSALNALELAATTTPQGKDGKVHIDLSVAEESIQKRAVLYDKDGDAHYDTISAFIKSVRGSDPDAALYWLARMVAAGEEARFLFRRMIILAAEDIGLADPEALRVVMSAAQAYEYVGMPEGQFHLAEACLYLATAPKSNSTFAFFEALKAVQSEGPAGQAADVPDALKDASRDGADLGHGKGYLYPHAYRDHWVPQQYLPSGLQGRLFYEPSPQGYEGRLRDTVQRHREAQWEAMARDAATKLEPSAASPNGRPNYRGGWLDRAAGVGSEVLRAVRERLFELTSIKRESLVLDLSGGTGFLTWEALRRARGGGVYTRCESAEAKAQLEGFARRLELFSQPVLLVTPLVAIAHRLREEPELPRFDAILGLDLAVPRENFEGWVTSLLPCLAPEATMALAFKQTVAQPVESLLPARECQGPFAELIAGVQQKQAQATAMQTRMEALQTHLSGKAKVAWETRSYVFPRRFTPTQARLLLEAEDGPGLFTALREAAASEWPALKALLYAALTSQEARWHYGYGYLTVSLR